MAVTQAAAVLGGSVSSSNSLDEGLDSIIRAIAFAFVLIAAESGRTHTAFGTHIPTDLRAALRESDVIPASPSEDEEPEASTPEETKH
jgi:hypothetical protein